jgi:cell division septation protein DedD
MQRGFGGTVFEPVQPERRDRELTLGPFTLTLLGCGLFALCGLCFVFGYAVGHRNADSSPVIALPPPGTSSAAQPASLQSKPSAGQTGAQPQQPVEPADSTVPTDASGTSAAMPSSTAQPDPASTAHPAEPVHAVLTGQSANAQPVSGAGSVQPALAQASGIMVQIAAVSHPEDAEVLVGALRKRGYAVTSRRDPTDGLLHVQIGPFSNRSDASAMRQKLLNDGYNAIVQP